MYFQFFQTLDTQTVSYGSFEWNQMLHFASLKYYDEERQHVNFKTTKN